MTDSTTGAAEQPAATIRDSLVAAITELEPEVAQETGTETPEAATEATAAERARDDKGRFAKREGEAEAAETTQTAPKPAKETKAAAATEQLATTEQPGDKTATTATEPPAHWSAEDKAFAQKLPAELRAEYIDRFKKMEAGFTPKLQRAAALEKDYGEVDQHFQPYAQAMQAQGWTKSSLIKAWADVELALAKDPYDQMRKIAQHYKVDLRKLAGVDDGTGGTQQPDSATLVATGASEFTDPVVKALQAQLQELSGQVRGMTEAEQRRAEAAQNAATQRTLNEIQTFAEHKGEDGTPSHPHFGDVLNDMLAMAQAERAAGRTPVLQELYDRAVWANPQTRATQIAATTAKAKAEAEEAQRKQAADAKARAEKARKVGSSVTGAPSGTGQASAPKSKGSLRDDILAAADEADG